jgi:lipoate-protein ligase B
MQQTRIQLYNLGRLDYRRCFNIQKYLLNEKLNDAQAADSILLVEHEPTYTIGIRRNLYKPEDLERLRSLNAHVEMTDRGGLITFHGPGQLVAYPILNLKNYTPSLKWYVRQLEEVIIQLCKRNFGLEANRLCAQGYTGVWCRDKKIAALGVHCKRYVTYHGLALNCNVDLKWFDHIVPCGIEDKKVTSLSDLLNRDIGVDEATPLLAESFGELFKSNICFRNTQETQDLISKVPSL